MSESMQQRLDRVIDHVAELGAKACRIVLAEGDLQQFERELRGEGGSPPRQYRGVPVTRGEIGGNSFVEADGTPSGSTNFGV